jgi:hypothetical protein
MSRKIDWPSWLYPAFAFIVAAVIFFAVWKG